MHIDAAVVSNCFENTTGSWRFAVYLAYVCMPVYFSVSAQTYIFALIK